MKILAIKDMEMPKCCGECRLRRDVYSYCKLVCPTLCEVIASHHSIVNRHQACPLIEVDVDV